MTKGNPFIPSGRNSFIPRKTRRPNGFGSLIRDHDRDGVPSLIDRFPKNKRKINGFGTLIRDSDRDRVPNIIDCAPRNPRKHTVAAFASGVIGSMVGGYLIGRAMKRRSRYG